MTAPASHIEANASVDASLRGPVLLLAALGLAGLALSTLLDLAAELALFCPDFAGSHRWANAGILLRAADAWRAGGLAAGMIGGGFWVLARSGGAPPPFPGFVLGGLGLLWAAGAFSPALRAAAAVLLAGAALVLLSRRREREIRPAAAFPVAAFLALPLCAVVAAAWGGDAGVAGPAALAWSGQGTRLLVLGPLGLGFALFLAPRIAARPLFHGGLAFFALGTLAVAGGWAGAAALFGGPFPAWFLSAGAAARLLLLVPAVAVAAVLAGTARGEDGAFPWRSPAFRFLAFALACYLLGAGDGALRAFRTIAAVVRFTAWEDGADALFLHGFAAFALWGLLYYAGPRLARAEWSSPRLIAGHFALAATAVLLEAGALAVGGLIQGLGLLDPRVPFAAVADAALPFHAARAAALLLFLAAQGVFGLLLFRLLARRGPARQGAAWLEEKA